MKFNKDIKGPTEITKNFNENLRKSLPFDNNIDFKEVEKGLIDTTEDLIIKGKLLDEIWNLKDYNFLKDDWKSTVNPSLWRQAQLNLCNGLFEVCESVFQVRGYDISNITIIERETGIIIIDPLVSEESAKSAMELYYKNRGEKTVKAVIYTHSHIDHYGGVKGVVNQEEVDSGKVEIIAPEGFMEEAVSENIFAGNAMFRRANYMYGNTLSPSPQGHVDVGLGKQASKGISSLIKPTKFIKETGEKLNIDGVDIEFIMANGTEAPSEFMMYYPQFKIFNASEVISHHIHNLYTLRGAKVRDARKWWKAIDSIISIYGDSIEILIAQHHWPKWGNKKIIELLEKERDAYKFLHDQSLRLANQGYNPVEISEEVKLPKSLEKEWYLRDYYGSFNHNSKAIYQFYIGWYDGNPANLYPLPPEEVGKKYVEFMGGADNVLKKAKESFDKGEYRWVAEVCKHIVFADPNNEQARYLEADALEQLAYQTETATWRNNFLLGAFELRNGVKALSIERSDSFLSMPTELIMDYIGLLVKKENAENINIKTNLKLTDRDEIWFMSLENSTFIYRENSIDKNINFELNITISELLELFLDKSDFNEILEDKTKFKGDEDLLKQFIDVFVPFENNFNIVTP
ncbi:alkyl sulfatase [Methanobrevibacter arboriphilus]|jgi:alkyl sulfatase BDS1-like metallo-beta-lactamase superfamily hydrolase|uniref:Alkyl sulfatase n=1 Tax=Methanobrevibacter arboriphilus TaxID=39441 RepID=A0ACA8R5H4_METAZ|nr:alkyl sulfatase dimerization domain-containing protein [Methanobrevibacter arboriphilus]BBL62937.1 alkyl sulfatase [Methanobrevibacter arboriphilus]GLI12176.1 alkyl sulfatase [Methanobrevibacter arboriphilus]